MILKMDGSQVPAKVHEWHIEIMDSCPGGILRPRPAPMVGRLQELERLGFEIFSISTISNSVYCKILYRKEIIE